MAEAELGRIQGDLAVIQRALGLHLPFGKEMVGLGLLLTVAAIGGAGVSLVDEHEWFQLAPLAISMVLGPLWLYLRSRRMADLSPEITGQVGLSLVVSIVVWGAAFRQVLATLLGPTVGAARMAVASALSISLLFAGSVILVGLALQRRERHYCLGLAISLLLAGLLLPVLDRQYSFPLAHGFMAIGYLTGVAIQGRQLRKAVTADAAD